LVADRIINSVLFVAKEMTLYLLMWYYLLAARCLHFHFQCEYQ